MYYALLNRLEYDEKNPGAARRDLDWRLDVAAWRVTDSTTRPSRRGDDARAPTWWHGDEDASQSFLRSVGAVTR